MDIFSFLQLIEKIPELRFKYMGLYTSDTVPQLTKNSFAVINSASSNDRGKYWIMIARVDKSYYFADSLGRKRSIYSFLTKKVSVNGSSKATKTYTLCGFYANCSALLLFKFFQKNLNNVNDMHILSFIIP